MEIQSIEFQQGKTCIDLKVNPRYAKTNFIPGFKNLILKVLPDLTQHKCYNESDISFERELEDTVLAHVFEHALIERIGQQEDYSRNIKGYTTWDWSKFPRHTYQIEIYHDNKELVLHGLAYTIGLFNQLLSPYKSETLPNPTIVTGDN